MFPESGLSTTKFLLVKEEDNFRGDNLVKVKEGR